MHLATDPRVGELIEGVPAAETHRIPSATFAVGSPIGALRGSLAPMLQGRSPFAQAAEARFGRPIVIGFGGYPTVPPLVAARLAELPIVVHEQNAVVGRANRLLLRLGAMLATGFERPEERERARRATVMSAIRCARR